MPKMKSNRGAVKRFKVTKSGLVKHRQMNRNHILTKKICAPQASWPTMPRPAQFVR